MINLVTVVFCGTKYLNQMLITKRYNGGGGGREGGGGWHPISK